MCAADQPGLGSVGVSPPEQLGQAKCKWKQSLGGPWFELGAGGSAAPCKGPRATRANGVLICGTLGSGRGLERDGSGALLALEAAAGRSGCPAGLQEGLGVAPGSRPPCLSHFLLLPFWGEPGTGAAAGGSPHNALKLLPSLRRA